VIFFDINGCNFKLVGMEAESSRNRDHMMRDYKSS